MSTLESLNWRYATKSYNQQSVAEDKLNYILEAIRLSPSSSGLQPYKVLVISNRELLKKIQPLAMNQAQVVECSHLLVFASWDKYSEGRLTDTLRKIETGRGMTEGRMDEYKALLLNFYTSKGEDWQANHTARQTYIAAGMAMVAAAEVEVDATPMEGFNNEELDALLELQKEGLKSQIMLPIGYRNADKDWNLTMPKYRKPLEELVLEIR